MFPIKYIDNNLVWNKDNEVFAYYELIPYNYSFLSAEQKFIVHDSFRQLIAQSREGKIHALQIATESSIRSMQEQSKKLVTGKLKEVACQKIDEQTEALVSMIGDNQVDYRFFLGFKLMVTEEQLNLKNIKKSAWLTFKEFLHEVNHTLMNDFVSMPNDEINRYMKMEKLLENKISRRFKVRRLEINDFGYLMEHLYGRDGVAYEDYEYQLPKKNLQKETLIKYYDLIRPTRCVIEESPIQIVLQLKQNALLGRTVSDMSSLSAKAVEAKDMVSNRQCETGRYDMKKAEKMNVSDRVMVLEYIGKHFSDYTEPGKGDLTYEMEYILCGKDTDKKNLESSIERLMRMREAANVAHIIADREKLNQTLMIATSLAGFSGNPAVVKIVQIGVVAAWS